MDRMKIRKIVKIIIAILVCQLAGVIGSIFTMSSIPTWYATLQKPSFSPPNWLFGPVWTTLFTLMGISLYLVWDRISRSKETKKPLVIFGVQLVLNIFWSVLFFGLKSSFYAFIEIIILWLAIAFNIFKFYKISKNAGLLLIPYLLWVTVATILNFYIWMLNP